MKIFNGNSLDTLPMPRWMMGDRAKYYRVDKVCRCGKNIPFAHPQESNPICLDCNYENKLENYYHGMNMSRDWLKGTAFEGMTWQDMYNTEDHKKAYHLCKIMAAGCSENVCLRSTTRQNGKTFTGMLIAADWQKAKRKTTMLTLTELQSELKGSNQALVMLKYVSTPLLIIDNTHLGMSDHSFYKNIITEIIEGRIKARRPSVFIGVLHGLKRKKTDEPGMQFLSDVIDGAIAEKFRDCLYEGKKLS